MSLMERYQKAMKDKNEAEPGLSPVQEQKVHASLRVADDMERALCDHLQSTLTKGRIQHQRSDAHLNSKRSTDRSWIDGTTIGRAEPGHAQQKYHPQKTDHYRVLIVPSIPRT